ncbi:MAG: hypothetical protein P1U53_07275 [Sulfitobacter sp.]|nr:hypothetical protein [Sulfitobacter sp.]
MSAALAIEISREGLKGEKNKRPIGTGDAVASQVVVDGLPFMRHRQAYYDPLTDETRALLSRFDLAPIVERLPRQPAGYLDARLHRWADQKSGRAQIGSPPPLAIEGHRM